MILITGAGGKTGRALIKALTENESICAFVHDEGQAQIASSLGAGRVVVGDMHDEEAIRSAMQGIRGMYHICPNMSPDEIAIGEMMIRLAGQSGIEHFVYHSVLHPQTEKMTHHWQKLRVEEMIFESGLPFTILQPAPYMQNWLAGWKSIQEDGILRVPYSIDSKFSFVDLQDIAEAAKIVLTEPGHNNATYELAGTPPLSHVDIAEIFSQVMNRDVRAEQEDNREWRVRSRQLSEYALTNLTRMFEYYNRWGLTGNSNILKWILKRDPTSLESFVRNLAQEKPL